MEARSSSFFAAMMSSGPSSKVMLLLVCLLACALANGVKAQSTTSLMIYAHEDDVGDDATVISSAVPTGNGTDTFGLIRTYSNVLREGPANDSTILGSQVGIVVIGKGGADVYLSFVYFLNSNSTYKGTIAVHGYIGGFSNALRQFPIVGGTGDFLSVVGVDRIHSDDQNAPDPNNIVNTHNLTLTRPSWAPSWT